MRPHPVTVRLYLSSFRLGRHATRILDLVGHGAPRVLASMNALDGLPDAKRRALFERLVGDFGALGADVRELDLRRYFSHPAGLTAALTDCDVIWANGGNAFTLLAAMRQSGFVDALTNLLRDDALVYGGYSAGAVVAGPTLRGIELVDSADPAVALPPGYVPKIRWDGMALVPYSIVPHHRSDHPESAAMHSVVRYLEERGLAYRALRDGEAILVAGDAETVLPA